MSLQTGIALLVLVVAIVGSAVVVALRGLQLKRTFSSFSESLTTALAVVEEASATNAIRAAELNEHTATLNAATERLQESLDRLGVLGEAAGDLRRTFGGIRRAVPTK